MRKILIPTDFSAQSNNAIKTGISIAKHYNAEIILLHILDLPQAGSDGVVKGTPAPEVIFFKNIAEKRLQEIGTDPIFDGLTVSTSLILDRTAYGVTKSAEHNEVDLIVIGSHGASGAKKGFVGSNTQKVVRSANVPVLVVKDDITFSKIHNIVFASDFSDEMKPAFENVLKITKQTGAKLHLLVINTPNNFKPTNITEEIVEKFLTDVEDKSFELNIYNDMSIERGIINFAEKANTDLVAIATHGRTGLAHFFNGSISEDLVNKIEKSVITFKIEQ